MYIMKWLWNQKKNNVCQWFKDRVTFPTFFSKLQIHPILSSSNPAILKKEGKTDWELTEDISSRESATRAIEV